jgi:hypothetical protein
MKDLSAKFSEKALKRAGFVGKRITTANNGMNRIVSPAGYSRL